MGLCYEGSKAVASTVWRDGQGRFCLEVIPKPRPEEEEGITDAEIQKRKWDRKRLFSRRV